jgi:uncharacterized membrane protein
MAQLNPPRSAAPRQFLWLSLLLIVAGFLRFYDLGGPSLWMDEIWSIEISTGRGSMHDTLPTGKIQTEQLDLTTLNGAPPWWKVWTTLNLVIHPPLYHIVLRWWMDAFGNSPAAVRALSALLSLIGLLVFYDVCRLLHGSTTALWATALASLSVAQLEFAQEARSYPMLILFGLLACDALVRIELRGANLPRLFTLGFCLVAAELTHYFAAPAIAALALYALLRLRGRDLLRTLIAFAAAAIFVAIVWGPFLLQQLHSMPSFHPDFLTDKSASPFITTVTLLLSLPSKFFCGDIFFTLHPTASLIAAIVAALIVIPLPLVYLAGHRRDMLIWILWLGAIVGFLTFTDLFRRASYLQYLRYSILAAPAVYAMLAGSRRILPSIALAACIYLAASRAIVGAPPKGDWRGLSQAIEMYIPPDRVLAIYYDDPFVSPGMWYMALRYYQPNSNRPWLLLKQPLSDELQADLHSRGSFWLATADAPGVVKKIVPGWQPADNIVTHITTVYQLLPENSSTTRP